MNGDVDQPDDWAPARVDLPFERALPGRQLDIRRRGPRRNPLPQAGNNNVSVTLHSPTQIVFERNCASQGVIALRPGQAILADAVGCIGMWGCAMASVRRRWPQLVMLPFRSSVTSEITRCDSWGTLLLWLAMAGVSKRPIDGQFAMGPV